MHQGEQVDTAIILLEEKQNVLLTKAMQFNINDLILNAEQKQDHKLILRAIIMPLNSLVFVSTKTFLDQYFC